MSDGQSVRFVNQKCGLCNGFGTLKYGQIVCHACKGKGVVVVDQQTGVIVEQSREETDERGMDQTA
jgi:DnaJ-class molecular chaperone